MCEEATGPVTSDEASATKPSRRALLTGGAGLVGGLAIGGALGTVLADGSTSSQASGRTDVVPATKMAARGLHVALLGTAGGPPPHVDRAGIASVVVVDGANYVVDAGRAAVTQYLRAGLRLADLSGLFLTHLHADHIADYFNFFLLGGWSSPGHADTVPNGTDVYGPGPANGLAPAFGGAKVPTAGPRSPTPGLTELTDRLGEGYAYSSNVFMRDSAIRDPRDLIATHEIELPKVGASFEQTAPTMAPFTVMEDDRVRVTAVLVPHGPVFPAFAYRFETDYGSVTFSGDTTYSDNLLTLAEDTDLLVHEAINLDGFKGPEAVVSHMLASHVKAQDVGTIAQKAGAKRLVLSHVGNIDGTIIDQAQWNAWARRGYDGRAQVGNDLDVFTVE